MQEDRQVALRALAPTPQGVGVFLTDGHKTIAIFVDPFVAGAISMAVEGVRASRPQTHELMGRILDGLGVQLRKVVIQDLKDDTFYARLYLVQDGDAGRHLLEMDARPSDSIAMAIRQKCPIFVRDEVWNRADDMTWALEQAMEATDGKQATDPPPEEGAGPMKGTE